MNGLPYYKRYPRDLIEGTIGLTFELKTTYAFILDLIYMQGGKLPDDPRYIAGILGVSVRKWNSLRMALIGCGKIQVDGAFLTNYRAIIELESLAKLSRKQSENRSRPNKNKGLPSPAKNHTDTDTENTLKASAFNDAVASSDPVDFTKEVFDRGVAFLGKYGIPERQARALVGKWRKEAGDQETFNALRDANREGVTEPAAWITARLRPKPNILAEVMAERKKFYDEPRHS